MLKHSAFNSFLPFYGTTTSNEHYSTYPSSPKKGDFTRAGQMTHYMDQCIKLHVNSKATGH